MSPDFVRYSPEIETIDPNIDELLARIIEFWERLVRESPKTEGTGRAVRGAHAKTLGLGKAGGGILPQLLPAHAGRPRRHAARRGGRGRPSSPFSRPRRRGALLPRGAAPRAGGGAPPLCQGRASW